MEAKIQLIPLLFVAVIYSVSGQSCGIVGVTNQTIFVPTLFESTIADEVFWSSPTFGIKSSAAIANPHNKYTRGLRYASKYEYLTEPIFPDFVQTERALIIHRDVIFTCDDDTKVTYNFIIPVEDENTEPPIFTQPSYNATVYRSMASEEPININIMVNDADVDLKNANLFIRSSNPYVSPVVFPLWTGGEIPADYYDYQIDFFVNFAYLEDGDYQIIVTADDGKFATFAFLNLTILP